MPVPENFADVFIYLRGMRDRSMRNETKLAREIQLTDRSTAGNLSNRSSGVQIPRDICTCFGRYLYSTKRSWIIMGDLLWSIEGYGPFILSVSLHCYEVFRATRCILRQPCPLVPLCFRIKYRKPRNPLKA